MDRFVSNFTNRLDSKGRVSIPASFRAALARDGHDGLFVHPSLSTDGLDAGGNALLAEIDRLLATHPPCSEERESLATALLGVSEVLKLDGEGRVILTESLLAHSSIRDRATFVGQGHKFQIWEPERFRARLSALREDARALKRRLGAQPAALA